MKTIARTWTTVVFLGLAASAWASEFQFKIPYGWTDLHLALSAQADTSSIPPDILEEAKFPYPVIAIDPKSTTRLRLGASFIASELPGASHVHERGAREIGETLVRKLNGGGIDTTLVGTKVVTVNGVDTAEVTMDTHTATYGERRVRQYLIPGHTTSALLAYSTPREDFDKFVPLFAENVRSTGGGFEHGADEDDAGWSWKELLLYGLSGVAFTLGMHFVQVYLRRRDAKRTA